MSSNPIVQARQQSLIDSYIHNPYAALITDAAIIEGENLDDPFHSTVHINEEIKKPFAVGVHRAVGGLHDLPNPGDILCASLAACFESTLRMVANRLQIVLKKTQVKATANVDVRGTLMMNKDVPVGFQKMDLDIEIKVDNSTKEDMAHKLLKTAEYCCVVLQTLKKGIPIFVTTRIKKDE